ncbi:carbohydrate porin [Microcoleus sp. AR_TQ3_B6]|uniref:carbohydrate porin n=1 Tax=Microcoleus sp. AR_TQ3_B6 TaxID=3055284 RepID=UPI002FD076F1
MAGTSNAGLAEAIGLPPGQRSDRDVGYHIEAFYTYRVNDNIAVTPCLILLTAANQNERNPDVVLGVVRTSFNF